MNVQPLDSLGGKIDERINAGIPAFEKALKAAGYRTIHVGKHGLAGSETSTNLTGTGSQNLALLESISQSLAGRSSPAWCSPASRSGSRTR